MHLLFRESLASEGELAAARRHFDVYSYTGEVPAALVVGRYSVLPYYDEVDANVHLRGGELIHSGKVHAYLADIRLWYPSLKGLTPTLFADYRPMELPEGSYVLKGVTNSAKMNWNRMMFAETKADVPRVYRALLQDTFIGQQGIAVREYVPLRTYGEGINGLPAANEWRTFWLYADGDLHFLGRGFYWVIFPEYEGTWTEDAERFVWAAALQLARGARAPRVFFSLDVAETEDGAWTVIEANEGQMSGLAAIDPDEFYGRLRAVMNNLRR